MLTILGWLFIGGLAGSIAQVFTPGEEPSMADITVVVGICGALIGGLITGSPFRAGHGDAGFLISMGLSVLGSITALTVYRLGLTHTLMAWLVTRVSIVRHAAFRPRTVRR